MTVTGLMGALQWHFQITISWILYAEPPLLYIYMKSKYWIFLHNFQHPSKAVLYFFLSLLYQRTCLFHAELKQGQMCSYFLSFRLLGLFLRISWKNIATVVQVKMRQQGLKMVLSVKTGSLMSWRHICSYQGTLGIFSAQLMAFQTRNDFAACFIATK